MSEKPTYKQLEQRIEELEKEAAKCRQIEEALRRSERRYRNIYDNAQVGLYRSRLKDGKMVMSNNRMAEMFGYKNIPEFGNLKQFHRTVTVKTRLDPDLLNIAGSHVHIRKVLMNLVSNASEAIDGSGHVAVSTLNRYIDKPLRGYENVRAGEYAVLAVSDDGSGISWDDLDIIMDPGMSGRETYERIIKIHPDQKALIASGFAETDEVKEAQKSGAGGYHRKPLTLEKLGLAVKDVLKKSLIGRAGVCDKNGVSLTG